jgi:hypothetical protein
MSDDIVTRLRGVCYDHLLDGHQEAQIVLEDAISEIQRLRGEVELYKDLYAAEIVTKAVGRE